MKKINIQNEKFFHKNFYNVYLDAKTLDFIKK